MLTGCFRQYFASAAADSACVMNAHVRFTGSVSRGQAGRDKPLSVARFPAAPGSAAQSLTAITTFK
jgi:hypothetical protein